MNNIFRRANAAQKYGHSQAEFVKVIRDNVDEEFSKWAHFRNLFERFDTRSYYTTNASLLYIAAEQASVDLAQYLIEGRADINTKSERYGGALQAACFAGHEHMVWHLLENNASMNRQGDEHGYAIAATIHIKDTSMVILLRSSCTLLTSPKRDEVLAKLAACGYVQGVKVLLEIGANANAQ